MIKKIVLLLTIVATITIGFTATGPFIAIRDIQFAIQAGNSEKLSERIDFPSLRASLKDQVNALVMREAVTQLDDNPFAALGMAFASKLIDGIVDSFVTPTGLANLMVGRKLLLDESEISKKNQGHTQTMPFENARYTYDGLSRFSAWVKGANGEEVRFVFTRDFFTWKLSSILVPTNLYEYGVAQTAASSSETQADSAKNEVTDVASAALGDDFRGHRWGASLESVKAAEKGTPGSTDDRLFYKNSLAGINVIITYTFLSGRLVEGDYMSNESHINMTEHINDYENLKGLLTKKYGKPKHDLVTWKNDLYRDDPSNWGFAISIGHLVYYSRWETDRTKIVIALGGDNYEVVHGITYTEKASEVSREEKREKEALDQM